MKTEIKELKDRVEQLEKQLAEVRFRLSWAGEPQNAVYGPIQLPSIQCAHELIWICSTTTKDSHWKCRKCGMVRQ